MMKNENRLRALETRLTPEIDAPWIGYQYHEGDGEAAEAKAREEATAKWEEENGPLGDIKPDYIATCLVSPKRRPEDD